MLLPSYPAIRYVAQMNEESYLAPLTSAMVDPGQLVITFDDLLRRTPFAEQMRSMLSILERSLPGAGGYRVHG